MHFKFSVEQLCVGNTGYFWRVQRNQTVAMTRKTVMNNEGKTKTIAAADDRRSAFRQYMEKN